MTSNPPPLEALIGRFTDAQQRFWESVIDTMNEALVLVGPDRRILYVNRRAEEITGAQQDEVAGVICTDALNCPQCSCRCRLFQDGDLVGTEVVVYHRVTGKPRTLLKNARLLRDAAGNVVCGVETFQDISNEVAERAEAQRNMQLAFEEKSQREALLAALPDGVFALDQGGRLLSLSARMAEIIGVDAEAARGRDLFELLGVGSPCRDGTCVRDLDGKRLALTLRDGIGAPQPAELLLRAVRGKENEIVGVLRLLPPAAASGRGPDGFHGIVSRAPSMESLFRLIESSAAGQANILVEGESGTGKELVARAIHALSPRRDEPFYAVNCATFQGSLLLSELFGHERGAFTGAYRTAKGKLELAGGGTLFLDEVSQIPLHYQGVLLRVLEERAFERVGGTQRIALRARIVSATNERLVDAVRAGRFREDLYYRLKVVPLAVPPLRERGADIDLLVDYFAQHPAVNLSQKTLRFTPAAREALRRHTWPGNVRELRNLVEYLCFIPDAVVDVEALPPEVLRDGTPDSTRAGGDAAERARIVEALERTGFRRGEAARLLGIDRTTLWRKMYRYGINAARSSPLG